MDLNALPSELVQEILDRVPFSEWLDSIILVCKEWRKLCETSRSQNKYFIINSDCVTRKQRVKLDVVLHIVSKYQVTGLDISGVAEVPSVDVLTASKQLKWLTLSLSNIFAALKASEPFDIETLSIERGQSWWEFDPSSFPATKFFENFPKVTKFSIHRLFMWQYHPPAVQVIQNAPANTEILHTSINYSSEGIYNFLDTIAKGVPRLKKLVLNLTQVYNLEVQEILKMYETLESYMEKNYGVRLVVRDPTLFLQHLDLFKEALNMNGLPYEYYTPYEKQTLFSHACAEEALDTMKYLIDSGKTTFEKELLIDPRKLIGHERIQGYFYTSFECPSLFIPPEKYVDLATNDTHRAIVDYLISLGLTCEAKGKNGEIFHEIFGVSHPIVPYVTLRSPPRSAAKTIHEFMRTKSPHYQLYLNEIYFKLSKETQNEVKKLLVDFDFSDVLYYVIESRDLQTIKHVVEEFNIDLMKYSDAINECPVMEENCFEIQDFINNLLGNA